MQHSSDPCLAFQHRLLFLGFTQLLHLLKGTERSLHIRLLCGSNSHHIIEGAFKSAARSLRQAVAIDPALMGEIPSTKGVL